MRPNKPSQDNLICLRDLTAKKIASMNTYNYAGFVGEVRRKGDLYIVSEITGKPNIVGQGATIETALTSFEQAVKAVLRETSKDSQRKMIARRFRKVEKLHTKINSINRAQLLRKVNRAYRMENNN